MATAPWYIETCVNAPLPVMSPTAQSLLARAHPLVGLDHLEVVAEPDGVQADEVEVGLPAGRDEQLLGGDLLRAEVEGEPVVAVRDRRHLHARHARRSPRPRTPSSAGRRPPAPRPPPAGRRPRRPSRRRRTGRTPARTRSRSAHRPARSRTSAARSAATASRLVQYGVPCRPSIGGAAGAVPVFSTTPLRATYVVLADADPSRAVEDASAADERRAVVLEPLDRDGVVPVVGGLLADPPGDRTPVGPHAGRAAEVRHLAASATTCAAAIIIFDGTHP